MHRWSAFLIYYYYYFEKATHPEDPCDYLLMLYITHLLYTTLFLSLWMARFYILKRNSNIYSSIVQNDAG